MYTYRVYFTYNILLCMVKDVMLLYRIYLYATITTTGMNLKKKIPFIKHLTHLKCYELARVPFLIQKPHTKQDK